ncbi:phage portal protein, partial [Bacillus vallismortis]|nr:phage portal protein [Bacillus vallismortis]
PYNMIELKSIAEYKTILQQSIDAYKVNITGFGFDVEYTIDVNASDVDQTKKKKAEQEWARLEALYKCLHFDESAEMILGYAIEDRE